MPEDEAVPAGYAERVVLLDDAHQPAGTALKSEVHTADTPLHLAFSVYVFDARGRFLATRRAVGKRTWPGVWSNTCCGHPAPGEDVAAAVRRRVRQELGLDLASLEVALPDFSYRAVAPDGLVENEVCPVYAGTVDGAPDPVPDAAEVAAWRWVEWPDFVTVATRAPWAVSPWAALQVPTLVGDPAAARVLDAAQRGATSRGMRSASR